MVTICFILSVVAHGIKGVGLKKSNTALRCDITKILQLRVLETELTEMLRAKKGSFCTSLVLHCFLSSVPMALVNVKGS